MASGFISPYGVTGNEDESISFNSVSYECIQIGCGPETSSAGRRRSLINLQIINIIHIAIIADSCVTFSFIKCKHLKDVPLFYFILVYYFDEVKKMANVKF